MVEDTAWEIALIMDKATANDKRLAFTDKIVYAYIQGFTRNGKWCFATSETIANQFGLSAPHVRQSRSKLEKLGLIRQQIVNGRKSFRTNYQKAEPVKTELEPVYENLTPVYENLTLEEGSDDAVYENLTGSVRNSYTECKKIVQPVYENRTHNSNIYINNNNSTHKSDRAREESATSATVLKKIKEGEEEQPKPIGRAEQLQAEYLKGIRSPIQIEAEIIAEGRDPNAKMDPGMAKQKFAELLETIARRKSA